MRPVILFLAALGSPALAAAPDGQPAPVIAQRAEIARIAAQKAVLEEAMGRLQLDMLVSDIVGDAPVKPRAAKAQLTMAIRAR